MRTSSRTPAKDYDSGSIATGKLPSPARSLADHIESLSATRKNGTSMETAVTAMANLVPGLRVYITFGGARTVFHESYTGHADLNHVARVWQVQGGECKRSDASFRTRLLQLSLLSDFQRLYKESDNARRNTIFAKYLTPWREFQIGCAHCLGTPQYCIPYGERCSDALLFKEELYQQIWGNEESRGGQWGAHERSTKASIEQLEEAIARSASWVLENRPDLEASSR